MSPQHGLYCAAGPGSARYADGMLVKKMDRKDLYSSAFVQPSLHSGTPYPCRAEDLETRNRPKLETKLPYITGAPCREVVREIEQFLDDSKRLSKSEMAAVERLAEGMRMDKWGADIIIKMFADIDALFFMGRLTNSVSIKWASPRDFTKVYGIGLTHGFTIYEGGKLSHIMLNSLSMIGRADIDPFSFMWMVVLHEMVHAYKFHMCGPIAPTKFDLEQGWGSHGQWFRRIIVAVDRRSRKFFNLSVIRDIDGYHVGHSAMKETSVKSSKACE